MKNDINLIASIFNKKYGIPVYSGTIAIESVLKLLNLKKESKVLISSTVCYSILQAILSANLTPIIAIPKNGVTLSLDEINEICKKEKIKVFIAVHQYGYEQVIPNKKDIIIIEDISQSWNSQLHKSESDYIITSLGSTKPLNNGIGGLILTNNYILDKFDLKNKESRKSNIPLLETFYNQKINNKKLIKKTNKKKKSQRKNAKILDEIFFNNQQYLSLKSKCLPSYHRYLVKVESKSLDNLLDILDKYNIRYQKEYKVKLFELPIIKERKIKIIGKKSNDYLLIRTDNKIKNLKKLKRKMEVGNG